jgi:hypothetical protein
MPWYEIGSPGGGSLARVWGNLRSTSLFDITAPQTGLETAAKMVRQRMTQRGG